MRKIILFSLLLLFLVNGIYISLTFEGQAATSGVSSMPTSTSSAVTSSIKKYAKNKNERKHANNTGKKNNKNALNASANSNSRSQEVEKSAHIDTLIKCFAKEETLLHKNKVNGPVADLNKELMNELLVDDSLNIKSSYLQKICSFKTFSPSVQFLHDLLLFGRELFSFQSNSNPRNKNINATNSWAPREAFSWNRANRSNLRFDPSQSSVIDGLLERAPELFVTYLVSLQSLTPSSQCLEGKIPEMASYLKQYQYQEDEEDGGKALFDKEKIKKIFLKLQNFDQIYADCKKLESKEKARELAIVRARSRASSSSANSQFNRGRSFGVAGETYGSSHWGTSSSGAGGSGSIGDGGFGDGPGHDYNLPDSPGSPGGIDDMSAGNGGVQPEMVPPPPVNEELPSMPPDSSMGMPDGDME